MKALAYSILALGAAISIWNISARMTRSDFSTRIASSCEYSDQIRLPVEAFGAHWRIQNFRKNVLFPNGFDDAFPRAITASELIRTAMDRPAAITIAPRTYQLKRTIHIDVPHKVEGAGSTLFIPEH